MKMKQLLLFSLLLVNIGYAQTVAEFEEHLIYERTGTGGWTVNLDYGDVDNDGDLDILSAILNETGQRYIGVFENLGDGMFSDIQTVLANVPNNLDVVNIKFFDYTDDGNLDVIVANESDTMLVVYIGNGDVSFLPNPIIHNDVDNTISVIEIVDFDNDGKRDILYGQHDGFSIYGLSWIRNLGNGNFAPSVLLKYVSAFIHRIETGNVNDDDNLDVVVTKIIYPLEPQISWLAGNDMDGLNPEQVIVPEIMSVGISLADFNGDGTQDLVYSSHISDHVRWLSNDGNGVFTLEGDVVTGITVAGTVRTGDIDQDGDVDIVFLTDGQDDTLYYIPNDGTGNFVSNTPIILNDTNDSLLDIKLLDIDNDSDLDILFQAAEHSRIIWIETTVLADSDEDGESDEQEIECGSDPFDPEETCATLGIDDISIKEIKVYPNPVQDILYIENTLSTSITSIEIFTLQGQSLIRKIDGVDTIDMTFLSSGLYILEITIDGITVVKKIVRLNNGDKILHIEIVFVWRIFYILWQILYYLSYFF